MCLPPKTSLNICFSGLLIAIKLVTPLPPKFDPCPPSVYTKNEDMILNLRVSVTFTIPSESIEISWFVPSIIFKDKIGDKCP